MIPPKYKFYIGKAMSFTMQENKAIDPSTGQQFSSINSISSTKVVVNSEIIYVNYSPSDDIFDELNNTKAEGLNIYMYREDYTYIGVQRIAKAKMCALTKDTKYIAVELIGMIDDIMRVHKGFVKSGFSEIFATHPIYPHYKELSKKYTKENMQEFFRISLEGKITLFGYDYEFVKNSSLDDTLALFIEKLNATTKKWYEYYKGKFNKTDCKFDSEKKKCELKLSALDAYTKIMSNYENTYDLLKLNTAISKIDLCKRSLTQVYIRGADSISSFFGGTYWEDDVNEAIDDHNTLISKYHFSYIKAGNEFYVKGAGISDVNGVYAGTNGNWICWKGYTCYFGTNVPSEPTYIYIKRNSDNTILYKSVKQYTFSDADNRYIGRDDIKMVNVNNSNDEFTIESPFVYHIYQRLLCDVDTITDSEGVKNTYDLPFDDFVADNRNYKKCIGLRSGLFFCTSRTVDEPTKYGMNDDGKYFTNKFIPSTTGFGRPLPICRNTWANASLWYVYDDLTYPIFEEQLRKKYTLRDSYSIAAVIKALLSKVDHTVRHEATAEYSKFLYGDNNPLYANRFYVFIAQKTNILKGQYDQAAQKSEITLEDVMKMLRDCFRCYWYIENNKLKIEHISFFMNGGSYYNNANSQLDFTKLKDMFNKKLTAYFQSETEFDKSELPSRYEFSWMDNATELFDQVTIDVKAKYIQQDKKEEINVSQFSSDVDFMLFNPNNFSNDGYALLCAVKNGSKYELPIVTSKLIDENGDSYQLISQNWYASWAYLVQKFYMHDMPAYNIDINVSDEAYVSRIKMCMKHTIEFPIPEDLDELKLINTLFGSGKIDEFTVNLNTRMAKVNLLYEPQ